MSLEILLKKKRQSPMIDYSHEVKLVPSKPMRVFMVLLSGLLLLVGVIGIFLPLLPTTPFVLLAAALYARSSIRFYNWIMNHPYMGPPLRNWKERGSIDKKNKIIAIITILLTFPPSVVFFIPLMAVKIVVGIIGLIVIAYIASRPSS